MLDMQDIQIYTAVSMGDPLSNNKDINMCGNSLSAESLFEKEKVDIIYYR